MPRPVTSGLGSAMTVLGATLQHNMKHVYCPSALKSRATDSPTFPAIYIVCICPYTYSLLHGQTQSHRLSESRLGRKGSLRHRQLGFKQLIYALLNDHYPLCRVHTQVHASIQAQVICQHLAKGVAGMSMLQPKSLAPQLSLVLE